MKQIDGDELYCLIDRATDAAILDYKFLFKMDSYLRGNKWTRRMTTEFIESPTAATLNNTILELDGYIKGGDKTLKEAYGHIPKPKARKIRDYLYSILEDAWKYEKERRPGRKANTKKRMKTK